MNLRKGLIAAATALTVSVAGVGVVSATEDPDTSSITALSSGSSFLAGDDEDGDDETEGSSSSSTDNEGEEETNLSSAEGLEELTGVLKLVSTAVGAVATIYGALTSLDIL